MVLKKIWWKININTALILWYCVKVSLITVSIKLYVLKFKQCKLWVNSKQNADIQYLKKNLIIL